MSDKVKKTGQVVVNMTVDEDALKRMAVKIIEENDFVKVVRCKDCKHHEELLNNNDGNVICWVHGLDVIVDRNGYCNYGE